MNIPQCTLLLGLLIVASACELNMRNQKKIDPLEASPLFPHRQAARPIPEGTIARGQLITDAHFYTGRTDGILNPEGWKERQPSNQILAGPLATYDRSDYYDTFPFPITTEVLRRGQEHFNIYCSPCHSQSGYGDGMIVRRGFPAPPSYHTQRLREDPPGRLFSVITNGYGNMYSYASRVEPADRWAIVAYIRALQLSQHAPANVVPEKELAKLAEANDEGR